MNFIRKFCNTLYAGSFRDNWKIMENLKRNDFKLKKEGKITRAKAWKEIRVHEEVLISLEEHDLVKLQLQKRKMTFPVFEDIHNSWLYCFTNPIQPRVVYVFNYKMFHQETSVEIIKNFCFCFKWFVNSLHDHV